MDPVAERDDELALVEKHDGFAVITMNRPEKRNAMNLAAQGALRAAMRDCMPMKAVILTGKGAAFCSGVDLVESRERRKLGLPVYSQVSPDWLDVLDDVRRHPAIFIAAVNGYALGGGLTLVNDCELAIASEAAEFGMPEIGFGTFPAYAGPSTIKRLLPKHAAQMIFTAQRIDAQTALAWGVVNEVVPADQVLKRACDLAAHVSQFDSVALDYGKRAYREILSMDWVSAINYGLATADIIRGRSRKSDEAGEAFKAGRRGVGQGAGG
jgi:enoyl-CoA hydratase/carnithine racemase